MKIFTSLAVLCLFACTADEKFADANIPDSQSEKIDVVLTLQHNWHYSSTKGQGVDDQIANGSIYKNKKLIEHINQPLPLSLSWTPLVKSKRSNPYFQIGDKGHSASAAIEKSVEQDGNIEIKHYSKKFQLNFIGKTMNFEACYSIPKYLGYEMVYTIPDSLKLINQKVSQPQQKSRANIIVEEDFHNDLELTLYGTQYPSKKVIEYQFIVPADFICPVEKEDIPDGGKIVENSEKLYPHPSKPNTYVSELDGIVYWSVSGPKQMHFMVEYDVNQSISHEDKCTVSTIEIGYPKIQSTSKQSEEEYSKEEFKDFKFTRHETEWTNTWSNGFSDNISSSYERAYAYVDGVKLFEMPYGEHAFSYDQTKILKQIEVVENNIIYNDYSTQLHFNGEFGRKDYDKYTCNLVADQEFRVKKGENPKPQPDVMEHNWTVDKKINDDGTLSTLIFHVNYSVSGPRDSIFTLPLYHKTETLESRRFVRNQHGLSLTQALDPKIISQKQKVNEDGYHLTTIEREHTFQFSNDITDKVTSVYQEAYMLFDGKRVDFLSSKPAISANGTQETDRGIVSVDGKSYTRKHYTLNYTENYSKKKNPLQSELDIDVEKDNSEVLLGWSYDTDFDYKTNTSKIIFHLKYKQQGEIDSVATQKLMHKVTIHGQKHIVSDQALSLLTTDEPNKKTKTVEINGNTVTKHTDTYNFKYNLFNGVNIEEYETAYTVFKGEKIDFPAPVPNMSHTGIEPKDGGIIEQDGKKYKRTVYTVKYQDSYGEVTTPYSTTVTVDALQKVELVKRTAINAKREYVSEKQHKLSFVEKQEFSDGSVKEDLREVFVDVFAEVQPRQTVTLPSEKLIFQSFNSGKTTTSSHNEGKWKLTTHKTLYVDKYQGLAANFWFTTTSAIYQDGDFVVEFSAPETTPVNLGYTNPWLSKVEKAGEVYNRYDCDLNVELNHFNHSYRLTHEAYVDVEAPVTPDIPDPIDWELTQKYGGVSWSFNNQKQPVLQATLVSKNNKIIVFNSGKHYDYNYSSANITGRLSAIPTLNGWIPAYLQVKKNPNIFWEYTSLDGNVYNMNGVDILKLLDVELNRPFLQNGEEYEFNPKTGRLRIQYTYTNRAGDKITEVLFNGYIQI